MTERLKVLVVDDSAFARKVLRESLQAHPQLDVVGVARDGLEALERIAELKPDAITLDLVMPNLDGVSVLRALKREDRARVVIVSMSDKDSELGVEALTLGAFDLVLKPTALATDRLYELAPDLVAKVLAAGKNARQPKTARDATVAAPIARAATGAVRLVVVGASTGGPAALLRFVSALPADLAAPVAIALHIPPGYTDALAARLDHASGLHVVEAYHGIPLVPGTVVIARGGQHLKIVDRAGALFGHLDDNPTNTLHKPSVDVLFGTAAKAAGAGTLAVVLTGMGEDGLVGARAIHELGGVIVNEAESTSVVYGMPRAVFEAGISSAELPLEDIADDVARRIKVRGERPRS